VVLSLTAWKNYTLIADAWLAAIIASDHPTQQGIKSLLILTSWVIWIMEGAQQQSFAIVVKKRVFNRQSSTVQRLVQINRDEAMDLCGS
jgi:hypothetical protein